MTDQILHEAEPEPQLAEPVLSKLGPEDPRHGTQNGYVNHRCRCEACKMAWAKSVSAHKKRRAPLAAGDPRHGTQNGYGNWGCRCSDCTFAYTSASVARRRRQQNKG